jgi:catechol 2,3-dioxygenase-like lactoylglutathione lyase family enzyme
VGVIGTAVLALVGLSPGGRALAQAASDNPMQLSPHHATLSVADLNKEAEWYERVLGFRETQHIRRRSDFELRAVSIPGYRFDLVLQKGSTRPPPAPRFTYQGYSHVVLETPILDVVYQRVVANGVKVEPEYDRKTNQLNHMTIWDPEDNEIEIFLPSKPPGGPVAEDIANPLRFAPHHVAITVANISTEAAWYAQVLGFRETTNFKNPNGLAGQFMDIPGYRLMLETKTGSIRPPARPPYLQQGYVHVVYQTTTLDADYKRLMALGVKIAAERDPKSKALIRMTMNDPEGNEIEIIAPQ